MPKANVASRVTRWIGQAKAGRINLFQCDRSKTCIRFDASVNRKQVCVYLDITSHGRHHCTCSEAIFANNISLRQWQKLGVNGMFCAHIVAAALKSDRADLLLPLLNLIGKGK